MRPSNVCATPTNEALFPSTGCKDTRVCTGRVIQAGCPQTTCAAAAPPPESGPMYSQNMPPPQQTGAPIGRGIYDNIPMEVPQAGYDDIKKVTQRRVVTVFATFSAEEAAAQRDGKIVEKLRGDLIFKKKINLPDGERSEEKFGDTKTMIMHSAQIISWKNSHMVPVAVDISGVPGNEHTADGKRHAIVLLSQSEAVLPNNLDVHRPLALFKTKQFQKYIGIKRDNLADGIEEAGDQYPPGTVFVSPNTVAASVLIENQDAVREKFDLNQCRTPDGRFLIGGRYMKGLLDWIHETVVKKMPYVDFGNLKVKLTRADADTWTDEGGVLRQYQNDPQFMRDVALGAPHTVEIKFAFNYIITNLL